MTKRFFCYGSILLLIISIGCLFIGCTRKEFIGYPETYFGAACDDGYFTQEQLKSIAYYYNEETENPEFELIPKAPLKKETEDKIKLSYLQRKNVKEAYPDATVDNIATFNYYGIYNDYAVVFIRDNLFTYDLIFEPEKIIDGVSFYNYCELLVYKLSN